MNKYQIGEISSNAELLVENANLWLRVKAYQKAMGVLQVPDFRLQEEYRVMQNQLLDENNQMKSVIAYYVKE